MTSESIPSSDRKLSHQESYYHGFILLTSLLQEQFRLPTTAVYEGLLYQLNLYRLIVTFLYCIGSIDAPSSWAAKDQPDLSRLFYGFFSIRDAAGVEWKLAVLSNKHHGLVPFVAHRVDRIVVVLRSSVPLVLREAEGGTSKLVGSCFFHSHYIWGRPFNRRGHHQKLSFFHDMGLDGS